MNGAEPPAVRMTGKQHQKVNALIKRLCANCDDGRYCLLLDDGDATNCPQMLTRSLCCRYFRAAVLPADGPLCVELMRGSLKRCAVCGAVFVPCSNRAKYCPGCAHRVHRRQKNESDRKRRSMRTVKP